MKNMKNENGFASIIAITVLIVLLFSSFAFYLYNKRLQNNELTKANTDDTQKMELPQNKNSEWKKFTVDASYGDISFETSDKYPINGNMFAKSDQALIDIEKYNIKIDMTERNITSADMQKYYNGLKNGSFDGKSPFSLWSNEKVEIKKTKSGKFFGVSTTFAAYDLCTLTFHTDISIPINDGYNDNIINVTVSGDTNKIKSSLKDSNVLTPLVLNAYGVPEGGCFTEDGMKKLLNLLTSGRGSNEIMDWYDTAQHVIETLDY